MKVSVNVALCSGQFAMSIMQTVFMFYYVKVFLNIFKVSEYWFNVAQLLFMVWNSVNDPLFGYLQDLGDSWMRNRRKVILYLSPFLIFSFYLLWFPWATDRSSPYVCGLHLLIVLFLYDAFYSCINVAWSALFAESTYEGRSRITAIKYSQLAILLSINILPITEKVSKGLINFTAFQYVSVAVGIIALFCFYVTGCLEEKKDLEDRFSLLPAARESPQSLFSAIRTTKQIWTKKDFICIIATNFIHTWRSVSHLNFATIATDLLIPSDLLAKGTLKMSVFYGIITLVPQILVIASGDFFVKQGVYRVVLGSFVFTSFVSIGFWLFFFGNPYLLIIFMFLDSVAVHSVAPLFQVLLAEFIDDDTKRFSRVKPISSMIFSLNALIVKPAQSIAPVVIVHILNRHNYQAYQQRDEKSEELITCMFNILYFMPFLLGLLQFIIFRNYSLRSKSSSEKQHSYSV